MFIANCENRDCLEVFDRFTNTVTLAQGWKYIQHYGESVLKAK